MLQKTAPDNVGDKDRDPEFQTIRRRLKCERSVVATIKSNKLTTVWTRMPHAWQSIDQDFYMSQRKAK